MIPATRDISWRSFVNFVPVEQLQRQQQGFIQMFNALRRTAALWASMVVFHFAAVTAAY
jgi:hypothetical protein